MELHRLSGEADLGAAGRAAANDPMGLPLSYNFSVSGSEVAGSRDADLNTWQQSEIFVGPTTLGWFAIDT